MTFKHKIVAAVIVIMLSLALLVSIVVYAQNKVELELEFMQSTLLEDAAKITKITDASMNASTAWREAMLWMTEEQLLKLELVDEHGKKLIDRSSPAKMLANAEVAINQVEAGLKEIRVYQGNLSGQDADRLKVLHENLNKLSAEKIATARRLIQVAANGKGDIRDAHAAWQRIEWAWIRKSLGEMHALSQQAIKNNVDVLTRDANRTTWLSITLGLLVFALVSGVLLWQLRFVSRTIGGRMERLFRHMDHIAKDDFSQPIRYRPGMEQ
ncbi:hypothetical protein, partial [Chromobacterium haemolyticum]|uniref:hypothetical protein n=1 Tax=Chromobacterium haemolyticum TaxID=394935 RepID=UPI0009F03093